ncbi:MAG: SdiA-regulated domain-containing protein [Chitinophagaceae bacterium]
MRKKLLIIGGICAFNACAQTNAPSETELQHYSPAKATTIELPKKLKEVSGITFMENNDSILYAEQDESANIYSVGTVDGTTTEFKTANEKGDFEDIAYSGNGFYLLRSDGMILFFPQGIHPVTQHKSLLPAAEYEGLCYHAADNSLYVLAKTIPNDKKYIIVYKLALTSNGEPGFGKKITVDVKTLERSANIAIGHFRPSAIAYNIVDRQWFLLSSINHLLLVLDSNWQYVEYAALDKKQYPQPEGMAFDSKGNLWLSSEANTQKYGKLYKLERHEK